MAWAGAADAALVVGALKDARTLIDAGLAMVPGCLALRVRQAQVASREGDRVVSLTAFRAGADLAMGIGQLDTARALLTQIRRLRPDDTFVRVQLAEIAEQLKDLNIDHYLRDVVRSAVRTNNQGLALEYARKRVALAGSPGYEARNELVELLRRMGDHTGELAIGRELLEQFLEHAEVDQALDLLQRLVASHSRNADLVLQLADLFAAVDDPRQGSRFYRHAVCLLQVENRVPEAFKALDQIVALIGQDEAVPIARAALEKGQVVDWEAIRLSLSQDQRRRIASEIGTGRVERRPSGSQLLPTVKG